MNEREALARRLHDHAHYLDEQGCDGSFGRDLMEAARILGVAQSEQKPVEDTLFIDRRLPILAMSADIEDDRVLRLMFRHKVTDTDRTRLIEVLNTGENSLAGTIPTTDEQIETACAAYAKATGYYVEFHRGLSSPSSDRVRDGMRAALSSVPSTESKLGFFANLTPEQQTSALEYDGPENHGDPALIPTHQSAPLVQTSQHAEQQPNGDAAGGGADTRCPICDWPMAESAKKGCVPGDCCYRPDDPTEQARIKRRRAELSSTDRGAGK